MLEKQDTWNFPWRQCLRAAFPGALTHYLTALQQSAAVLFCLSMYLHVKQYVMAGNCMILSSSSRILLTMIRHSHTWAVSGTAWCWLGCWESSALVDLKSALEF